MSPRLPLRSKPKPSSGPLLSLSLAIATLATTPASPQAASCCGGGGGGGCVLPRGYTLLLDLSAEAEKYDGYWDLDGLHKPDPAGSRLVQYRLTPSIALRISPRWQVGATVPLVWNSNVYSGIDSHTHGLGDSTFSAWYEAFSERSAWQYTGLADLIPSITLGSSVTLPTGLSPYDDVTSSFDVTGRGFYRIDGTLALDKSYRNLSASVSASYGVHIQRPVNRFYGSYVEPYHKRLGDRVTGSFSLAYKYFIGTAGDALAAALALSRAHEGSASIDGVTDSSSGMDKTTMTGTLTYSSLDRDWSLRASWNHSLHWDGWGKNFPTTDIFTLGVRYAFR